MILWIQVNVRHLLVSYFIINIYFHCLLSGGQYMVVDCGGGTVDITVHEVSNKEGHIKEVFKATGGPYGSTSKHEYNDPRCILKLFNLRC